MDKQLKMGYTYISLFPTEKLMSESSEQADSIISMKRGTVTEAGTTVTRTYCYQIPQKSTIA